MDKNILYSLLITTSAFLISGCTSKQDNQPSSNSNQNQEETFSSTLKELIGGGKNIQCQWESQGDEKNKMSGQIFISGNKFYQKATTQMPEDSTKTMEVISVSDGNYMYTWNTNDKDKGMKISLDKAEDQQQDIDSPQSPPEGEATNLNQETNFKCKDWNVDNSLFSLPSDITFIDLDEMMSTFKQQIDSKQPAFDMPQIPSANQ